MPGSLCVSVCVLVAQLCLTLCDPMGCSPPDSPVPGILQARILEWVATSFSRGSSQPRDQTQVSCTAGGFFTNCTTWEAYIVILMSLYIHSAKIIWDSTMGQAGFSGGSDGKESACSAGDLGLIPGLGRSPGEGNGYPHQYSCLEVSMDRGAWWATVYGVVKSQTRLSDKHFDFHTF